MTSAVLLMAHGTPSSLDEMPEYLRLVRGGRPPSSELVAEMRHNYQAIGGVSPLTRITLEQADALAELATLGIERVIGIPMAPQFSTLSVQKYAEAARATLPGGVVFQAVE